jgi:hypothetical protein
MSATYNWSINSLSVLQEPKSNYVVKATWSLSGSVDNFVDSRGGITEFKVEQNDHFVNFEELTEQIVLDWVKTKLGEATILEIKKSISASLDAMQNPKPIAVDVSLPWAN